MPRLVILLACAASALSAQAPPPRPELVTSVASLAATLADPALVILQVERDPAVFAAGHVPGARLVSFRTIVTERGALTNELPPPAQLESVLESAGVSDDSRIVIYGEPLAAARLFFTLDYLGLGDQSSLLDGGLPAWKAAGRPISTEEPAPRSGQVTPRVQPGLLIEAPELARRLGDSMLVVIDARPPAEWSGTTAGDGVPRPGHIPGARPFFWRMALTGSEPPYLKDPAVLGKLLGRTGAVAGKELVIYCRTGVQASHLYFVARTLGFRPRLYDGSFVEWSGLADLPVER